MKLKIFTVLLCFSGVTLYLFLSLDLTKLWSRHVDNSIKLLASQSSRLVSATNQSISRSVGRILHMVNEEKSKSQPSIIKTQGLFDNKDETIEEFKKKLRERIRKKQRLTEHQESSNRSKIKLEYPQQAFEVMGKSQWGGFIIHEKTVLAKVGQKISKGVAVADSNNKHLFMPIEASKLKPRSNKAYHKVFWSDNSKSVEKKRLGDKYFQFNERMKKLKEENQKQKDEDVIMFPEETEAIRVANRINGSQLREDVVIRRNSFGGITGTVRKSFFKPVTGDSGEIKASNESYYKTETFDLNIMSQSDEDDEEDTREYCPVVPPNLIGSFVPKVQDLAYEIIGDMNEGLQPGGHYSPPDCKSRSRVAIIIPFRNRDWHLRILMYNLHPFLIRQQIQYSIYVVEHALPGVFNKAMMMNIGYVEALKRGNYQCVIFHDVDLIPENDLNLYSCPKQPRHMSMCVDKFNYKLPYNNIFGGVVALSKEHFLKANGFSNIYYGWGGEDDDLGIRLLTNNLNITRYTPEIARYRMIQHKRERLNRVNDQVDFLVNTAPQRFRYDGLSTLHYSLLAEEQLATHTWILTFPKKPVRHFKPQPLVKTYACGEGRCN